MTYKEMLLYPNRFTDHYIFIPVAHCSEFSNNSWLILEKTAHRRTTSSSLDATEVFIADLIACSTCFGHHYAHQLRVMCPVCRMLVYCILQTGHITLSSTPDHQLENHSTTYHRQQPLYNTLELLMMGIVVLETCWASNKICNKNLCCI